MKQHFVMYGKNIWTYQRDVYLNILMIKINDLKELRRKKFDINLILLMMELKA